LTGYNNHKGIDRILQKHGISKDHIQIDFKCCADILASDRTPRWVTIEPIMPYTNVDIFREKGAESFSRKVSRATDFYEKNGSKKIITFFVVI
jgi:hypothetical protein